MYLKKVTYNYFLILFALIPVSIVLGSTISLINILLIDVSFVFLILKIRNFSFLKNDVIKYLFILYLYLIFNSLISIDIKSGIYRNLGFLRIIILFIAFNFFFNQKFFIDKLFKIWIVFFTIIVFDVYFEYLNGTNMLGFPDRNGKAVSYGLRIVSFFKDEPIVGGFINSFYLIIIGFLSNKYYFKYKNSFLLITIILLLAIFLTGERANTIKAFVGIFLFISFFSYISKKIKIIFFTFSILSVLILLFNSEYFKLRYITQIKSSLNNQSQYFNLYKSGFEVFKNHPLFGVGNKNYRVESCENFNDSEDNDEKYKNYLCTTHPHQIYFELLSEHGVIGTLIILFIFYKIIFSKVFLVLRQDNYIQKGSMIFLLTTFLPLLPSGSFFNDYSITIFGINLAIFYSSNKNLNIFN